MPRAASVADIRQPADLVLPPELEEVFSEFFPHLTEADWAQFIRELAQAFVASKEKNNLRPLQEVIHAWYRTLVVRDDPDYEANVRAARRARPKRGVSLEELRERFGV
jgi:uncharacterized protein DUF6247